MISAEKETILQFKTIYDSIINERSEEIENSSWTSLSDNTRINLSRTENAILTPCLLTALMAL